MIKKNEISVRAIKRTVARIAFEITQISENGIDVDSRKEVLEHLSAIIKVATAAINGDKMACCIDTDFGPRFFDDWEDNFWR